MRIASIDIGTNTLLLLVMDYQDGRLSIVEDHHKIARLGENLNQTGVISENAIKRAIDICEFYQNRLSELKPDKIIACATSAMRDANNSNEVKNTLEKLLSVEIEVISGNREASLSYFGSTEFKLNTVIDIGGGSTEIIQGSQKEIFHSESINIGAVRITEMFDLWNKEQLNIEKARNHIKKELSIYPKFNNHKAIAVAGTPNTLATLHLGIKEYSREKLHLLNMTRIDLKNSIDIIINTSKNDLVENHGVHPNRADVILGGSLILDEFMNYFEFENYFVSSNGLRFGIIKDYNNSIS